MALPGSARELLSLLLGQMALQMTPQQHDILRTCSPADRDSVPSFSMHSSDDARVGLRSSSCCCCCSAAPYRGRYQPCTRAAKARIGEAVRSDSTARHEGRSPRLLPNRRIGREKQSLHSLAIPWPTPRRVVRAASDNHGPCVIAALFRSQH